MSEQLVLRHYPNAMELLPYEQFSALRIDQFVPRSEIYEDDTGLEETLLGFNRCRHYFTAQNQNIAFFYPDSPPKILAAVDLSVQNDSGQVVVQRILTACAPPLRLGMTHDETLALLGKPEWDRSRNNFQFCRIRVGKKWPYRVIASFEQSKGLWSIAIVRDDYFVDDDANPA